jgi:hypothetical protein
VKKISLHTWIGLATFVCLAALIGVARATTDAPPKAPAQQSALPEGPDCLTVEGKGVDMRITAVNATVHCYYNFYAGRIWARWPRRSPSITGSKIAC